MVTYLCQAMAKGEENENVLISWSPYETGKYKFILKNHPVNSNI